MVWPTSFLTFNTAIGCETTSRAGEHRLTLDLPIRIGTLWVGYASSKSQPPSSCHRFAALQYVDHQKRVNSLSPCHVECHRMFPCRMIPFVQNSRQRMHKAGRLYHCRQEYLVQHQPHRLIRELVGRSSRQNKNIAFI